jgi:N-acylneuraminate cytidylyltransferase
MRNLAIIPARGGSKRIPKKNIKDFFGKPIISYSIKVALDSGLFNEVMVSTDSIEIAEIAKKYNAKVPFLRSSTKSNDYCGLADVIIEVLEEYKKAGIEFDNICCILATAPFISKNSLTQSYKKLNENNFDSIFPVIKYSFPIQRALQFDKEKIQMIWPENLMTRSQDLTPSFHDAGLFYWIKKDILLSEKKYK